MAVAGNNTYPSIESVLDLVRSTVLDDMAGATDTVGEGQIYVDDTKVSVTLSNFFNNELEEFCKDVRITSGPMLMRDNYLLLGLPPINSSLGLAAPNPAVQCYVDQTGYFDGTEMHPGLILPQDFLQPDIVMERLNNSNGRFIPMTEAVRGLSSSWQGSRFGEYEWREDRIYLHGALTTRDLRLRYYGTLVDLYTPGVDLATTYIPIKGCKAAVADRIVVRIARRIMPERLADAQAAAASSLLSFRKQQAQQKQGQEYETETYGSEAGPRLGF
jgi:hypothetical protein